MATLVAGGLTSGIYTTNRDKSAIKLPTAINLTPEPWYTFVNVFIQKDMAIIKKAHQLQAYHSTVHLDLK